MSINYTVEFLIDVLEDTLEHVGDPEWREHIKNNIRYARQDLEYKPQPDDWTKSPKGDFFCPCPNNVRAFLFPSFPKNDSS